MNCLYCGKDIGTLRLLRDSEFCSAPHRKSYKERLGRVLNQFSDDHAAPPPLAGFRTEVPPLQGNISYTMLLWQSGHDYPLRGIGSWPVAVPELAHLQPRNLVSPAATAETEPTPILDLENEEWVHEAAYPELELAAAAAPGDAIQALIEFEQAPPVCDIFSVIPDPEIAARWLDRAVSAPSPSIAAAAVPPFAGLLPAALSTVPDLCGDCQPVPPAEPVTAWMSNAGSLASVAFAAGLQRPALTAMAAALSTTPDLCDYPLPVPTPEPVTAWLTCTAAADRLPFASSLQLPAALSIVDASDGVLLADRYTEPDLCGRYLPVPAAEPVAAWVMSTAAAAPSAWPAGLLLPAALDAIHPVELPYASEVEPESAPRSAEPTAIPALVAASAAAPAKPALPALTIEAELEPLPILEEPLEIPEWCGRLMSAPQPEPVWCFLNKASASELDVRIPQARPVMAGQILRTHMPLVDGLRQVPQAEPVMAGVWPRIAETPLERIHSLPAFRLPEVAGAPALPYGLSSAAATAIPAPEPVETLAVAAHAAVPAAGAPALHLPSIAAVDTAGSTAWLALPVAGPEPQPVEAWIAAAAADSLATSQEVALQPFQVEGPNASVIPMTDLPVIAATAARPEPATGRLADPRPVSTIQVTLPDQRHQRPVPAIPQPGLVAIEYHMQRTRSVTYARPEWKAAHYQPLPPAFALRAALDNPEDLIKPKAPLAGVFPINSRMPRDTRSAVMEHILRVAAAVLIITTIWVGANGLKNARRVTVRQEESAFSAPNRVLTPESQRAKAKTEGKGPVNWVRQAVVNRASVQVAEDFQGGMQKWGAGAGTLPANWRRSTDGYVQTGALALFSPTARFSDYKLEFFGQIENKSLGWVVRAKDDKNYHAMKFTTIEGGLRPVIAMIHYSVIDGKQGRRTQIPLNVMVHNNRPFQVAITVRGKHFITELDGEEVDTFREDALPEGGVGFFSDAGERARLYWARVTKNDDWLGHVCAFLSGGESQATAEVWPPHVPGGAPSPWTPGSDSSILTAAWIGLPSIRRTHSPRRQKRCSR